MLDTLFKTQQENITIFDKEIKQVYAEYESNSITEDDIINEIHSTDLPHNTKKKLISGINALLNKHQIFFLYATQKYYEAGFNDAKKAQNVIDGIEK